MSKNNFFVKFAYFYKDNLQTVKGNIGIFIFTIFCLLSCFLPFIQILLVFISRYYTDEELKDKGYTLDAGYYPRWHIKNRHGNKK